jgi:hypothetical protein
VGQMSQNEVIISTRSEAQTVMPSEARIVVAS